MKRRQFLFGTGALAGGLLLYCYQQQYPETFPKLASALRVTEQQDAIGIWNPTATNNPAHVMVRNRAHGSLVIPKHQSLVYFARRPGTISYVMDLSHFTLQREIHALPNRHFYGHGCLSSDENYLYTTENNINTNQGCIGVYDCRDGFKRVDEIADIGIGPHEIAMMPDGKTLVVGIGGIQTHPASGRKKLNLPTMQPALAYIDITSKRIVDSFIPPDHRLSLRHLAVSRSGKVTVGAQLQSEEIMDLPLLFQHGGEKSLQPLAAPDSIWLAHHNYTASVAVADNGTVAVSSPRGGIVSFWNSAGQLRKTIPISDAAGIAYDKQAGSFWLSSGVGKLYQVAASSLEIMTSKYIDNVNWDNHLSLIATT